MDNYVEQIFGYYIDSDRRLNTVKIIGDEIVRTDNIITIPRTDKDVIDMYKNTPSYVMRLKYYSDAVLYLIKLDLNAFCKTIRFLWKAQPCWKYVLFDVYKSFEIVLNKIRY